MQERFDFRKRGPAVRPLVAFAHKIGRFTAMLDFTLKGDIELKECEVETYDSWFLQFKFSSEGWSGTFLDVERHTIGAIKTE